MNSLIGSTVLIAMNLHQWQCYDDSYFHVTLRPVGIIISIASKPEQAIARAYLN